MLDSDKLALEQNTAAIKCKLIVKATDTLPEIVLTDSDAIKDWIYTDDRYVPKQGFIGQFVARTLEGNLQNITDDFNIEGREVELIIGIVDLGSRILHVTTENGLILITEDGDEIRLSELGDGDTNWYSFGNFIITNPEDNEVKDNTKFEAMDYTKLFNKRFDGNYTDSTYTTSYNDKLKSEAVDALWLAKYTCAQVGVDFPQETFTNSDFSINQNPFQAGESCRDVLKEIAKLAYSWVRVGWDNKCYIDFDPQGDNSVDTYNIIDNNQYYTLETKKTVYGPINNIVVGMAGIDGESHSVKDEASIVENGEHTLYIYNNPFTNTFELRELAQRQAHKLFGLTYVHMEVETVGHPWLQGHERINVLNMEGGDNFTYAFNKSLNYTGHIRSTLNSMGDSEVEETLAYESDVIKNYRNASINVDKQNGKITALVEDIEKKNNIVNEKINTLEITATSTTSRIESVEKSVTDLEDSVDDKLALISDDIDEVQVNLDDFKENEYVQGISNLQKQIDGAIQFWNGEEIPTLNNYPAKDWTTENDRINHQADIYTVIEDVDGELKQGKSYRFDKVNGNWIWIELTDNELSAVQALAQEALDKAKANADNIVLLKSDVSELEQTDTQIKASVDSIENTLVPLSDASGSHITLTDSTDALLVDFKLEGKSTQETRSGYNLLNITDFTDTETSENVTIAAKDGCVSSTGSFSVFTTRNIVRNAQVLLPPGTYTIFVGNRQVDCYYDEESDDGSYYKRQYKYYNGKPTTFTSEYNVRFISLQVYYQANTTYEPIYPMVLSGEYTVDTLPPFEQYGATPSPDYPSEIKSVGYENLFDFKKYFDERNVPYTDNGDGTITFALTNNSAVASLYDTPFEFPTSVVLSGSWFVGNTDATFVVNVYTNGSWTDILTASKLDFTNVSINKIRFNWRTADYGKTVTFGNLMITKEARKHPYIPYGKSGIELETVGKNLLNPEKVIKDSNTSTVYLDSDYIYYNTSSLRLILKPSKIKEKTSYYFNLIVNSQTTDLNHFMFTAFYTDGTNEDVYNVSNNNTTKEFLIKFKTNGSKTLDYVRSGYTDSKQARLKIDGSFISEKENDNYETYRENKILFVLNEPLRSLPNGVKDIVYIKNSKLYVDRYVGSLLWDGSPDEDFGEGNTDYSVNTVYFGYQNLPNVSVQSNKYDSVQSNLFINRQIWNADQEGLTYEGSSSSRTFRFRVNKSRLTSLNANGIREFLSKNNVKIIYELAEPYTEDYGEIKYPTTYKNITHITTNDDLEPNMNITYVREGSMTDYIEGQFTEKDIVQERKFSELSVKADSISATVTSVEGDLAETNSQINKLEAKLTDQEATITIVSSHINKDTNTLQVSEVTTTNGFTFNAEGLNIYTDEDAFNTQINNIGTYYRDGNEIIGKTTKDGSLLKNLSLQGQTNYSYDGDSYDFIEERVYTEGEYCYATFYNGEE